jgi:CHAT domain-containing protein/Tfp pilus assembly protein PilF
MRPKKLVLSIVALLTAASTAFAFNFLTPFFRIQVLGQSTETSKSEAEHLLNLCREQFKKNQFQAALQSCQQAATTAQRIGDRSTQIKSLINLGLTYLNTGNAKEAIANYQQALAIARTIKERDLEGNVLGKLGGAYQNLKNYVKAIEYYQQSLAIAREIKDAQLETAVLQALAQVQNNSRKPEADKLCHEELQQFQPSRLKVAIQSWEKELLIYRERKDRQGEGITLSNLGNAHYYLGEYAKAIKYLQQSLVLVRKIIDRQAALSNLGNAHYYLGEYTKAIEYEQQNLAIAREIKNRQGEGAALGNLGNAYRGWGKYAKAIDYGQQSLAIAREIKNRPDEAKGLGNLGIIYLLLGDYSKAIEYQQQSLAIAKEIKDPLVEGRSLGNLGDAYYSLGEYAKAIEYQQQSLALAREIKNCRGESAALRSIGVTYMNLGDYALALNYQQQSLAIATKIQDTQGEGKSLMNIGILYFHKLDYQKAIEYQQQSLAIATKIQDTQGEGKSLMNIGILYIIVGEYPKAIENLQQSLAIAKKVKDPLSEGQSLGNIGTIYLYQGDYTKAIENLQQSLAIATKIKDRQGEGRSLSNLGFAFYKQGNLKLAEITLIKSINVFKSLRGNKLNDSEKVSFFDTQSIPYNSLQQVLVAQNKNDAALEIAESGRARAFVELLANKISPSPQQESLASPTIEEIKQIAKTQNATLVQYSISSAPFKFKGKIQFQESELYIWVIKPTGEVTFRKADLKPLWEKQNTSLENLVTKTLKDLGVVIDTTRSANNQQNFEVGDLVKPDGAFDRDPPWKVVAVDRQNQTVKIQLSDGKNEQDRKFTEVTKVSYSYEAKIKLQQLHKILIDPIADSLPKNERDRVIFIPQGSLFFVPFPALQDADRNYLIQKHTILTAPAIQVLNLTHQKRQQISGTSRDVLVIGNPTMPKVSLHPGEAAKQLASLPNAEIEAKEVAQIYKTNAIIGNKATKSAILPLLPKARIIHLATHGLLDDFTGGSIPGAVALAPEPLNKGKDERNNGLLTASEIFDLKLNNTELVVLSACDTGRGKITGDGVIGLSRSLISAGVPSVIVSLWSIPDAPTASLMREFYQRLQQSNDKASALRQAMLKTMEKHPDPENWAAFTLIGESN